MTTKFLNGIRKILATRSVSCTCEPSVSAHHDSHNPQPPHIMQEKKSWCASQVILFFVTHCMNVLYCMLVFNLEYHLITVSTKHNQILMHLGGMAVLFFLTHTTTTQQTSPIS